MICRNCGRDMSVDGFGCDLCNPGSAVRFSSGGTPDLSLPQGFPILQAPESKPPAQQISRRDFFAGLAMMGLLAYGQVEGKARHSVRLADALIKELDKEESK